jgi:hypothetical protein
MRMAKRFELFKAVQRENTQVLGLLRHALLPLRLVESPSPDQGGLLQPPSPYGGIWAPSVKVTYRRHLTLTGYFLHCG